MANQLNSGTLDTLNANETLLLQARKVANGKIQLEVAESVQVTDRPINVLGMLNKSDDRFKSNARRTWITAEPTDATELFGVDFGLEAEWYMGTSKAGASVELLDLNILNPTIKGAEGAFITHDSNYIFSNTTLILTDSDTKEMHTFLTPDSVAMESKTISAASMINTAVEKIEL